MSQKEKGELYLEKAAFHFFIDINLSKYVDTSIWWNIFYINPHAFLLLHWIIYRT